MPYKKVYYDEVWEITSKGGNKCIEWEKDFEVLNNALTPFTTDGQFKGAAADSIKSYITEIHTNLVRLIFSICRTYVSQAASYYNRYLSSVDAGVGYERYTTIVYDEVNNNGSIISKLKNIENVATQVSSDANSVKNSISHLLYISSSPKLNNLTNKLHSAMAKAADVSNKVIAYENSRSNDFTAIDELISQAQSIINYQLGQSRIPVVKYQNGGISLMCDIDKISVALTEADDIITSFQNSEDYDEAMNRLIKRDEFIKKEEQESREWVKWVAVGIAVVGSVVLIAVTAGGASPVVCGVVGAVSGMATTASSKFADHYVETGSFTEGMDWNDFAKSTLIAGATGFVGGAFGATSMGSSIQQPIKGAVKSVVKGLAETTAGNLVNTAYDVGLAIYQKKPGDQIIGILQDDAVKYFQEATSKGAGDFVEGYIETKFGINTGEKGYLKRVGEEFFTNATKETAENVVDGMWKVGDAYINNGDVNSVLKDTGREIVGGLGESAGKALLGEIIDGKPKGTAARTIFSGADAAMEETGGNITKGVAERSFDYAVGDEKDASKIVDVKTIWDEDLQHGRNAIKEGVTGASKTLINETTDDKKIQHDMQKIDHDRDGKVDMIGFDNCDFKVTKQDFEAAREVAGHGAYKDKTVQDILGLPKDTNIGSAKEYSESYKNFTKYSSNRKTVDTATITDSQNNSYVVRKDNFVSAQNVAGKGDYKDKSVNDILDIPDNVDISKSDVSYKRVDKDLIGKEVKLTDENSPQAAHIKVKRPKNSK